MADRSSEEKQLPSYSVTERIFYLMTLQCEHCRSGPFARVSSECSGDGKVDIWYVRCRACNSGRRLLFDRTKLRLDDPPAEAGQLPVVNPFDDPSELLDVGQWLALFYAVTSAAAAQSDRAEVQRLGYEATLCLEEALKFYPSDSELPRPDSFFTDNSKRRFKEHPEQFARDKLHVMRQKLPSLRVIQAYRDTQGSSQSNHHQRRSSRRGWLSRLFARWRKRN